MIKYDYVLFILCPFCLKIIKYLYWPNNITNMLKREKLLFYSITALGISSIITQLILMREFVSIFYGNELVFGIILAKPMNLQTSSGNSILKMFSSISRLIFTDLVLKVVFLYDELYEYIE